jgi:hypothetical protein
MENMEIEKSQKVAKNFVCEYCNYVCSRSYDFNKHLTTRKHQLELSGTHNVAKTHVCVCGRDYKTASGLWKHRKTCTYDNKHIAKEELMTATNSKNFDNSCTTNMVIDNTTDNKSGIVEIDKEMLVNMLLKNQEVMEKMIEMMPNMGNITNTNSHNTTNNQFNIQMFLNNHCKNAMNLTDFIDSLPITAETYDSNIDNGLTKTIANMFTTGLNQLDILERPIHCTDASRKTLYVKEGDVWEKDSELTKMIQGIRQMAAKQRILINTWRDAHDDWNVNDRMQDRFTTLVCNMVEDIENQEKETNKIIRSVSKEVYLNSDTKNKYLGQL